MTEYRHEVVRQIVDDDGHPVLKVDQRWHYTSDYSGDHALLCTGEFLSDGAASGNGELYEFKTVKRGGITCERCIQIIRAHKAVRL